MCPTFSASARLDAIGLPDNRDALSPLSLCQRPSCLLLGRHTIPCPTWRWLQGDSFPHPHCAQALATCHGSPPPLIPGLEATAGLLQWLQHALLGMPPSWEAAAVPSTPQADPLSSSRQSMQSTNPSTGRVGRAHGGRRGVGSSDPSCHLPQPLVTDAWPRGFPLLKYMAGQKGEEARRTWLDIRGSGGRSSPSLTPSYDFPAQLPPPFALPVENTLHLPECNYTPLFLTANLAEKGAHYIHINMVSLCFCSFRKVFKHYIEISLRNCN